MGPFNSEDVLRVVMRCDNVEEAKKYIESLHLKRDELIEVCRDNNVLVPKSGGKEFIIEHFVMSTLGAYLRSKGIREYK